MDTRQGLTIVPFFFLYASRMIKPEVLLIVVVSMLATAFTLIEVGKTIKPPENQSVKLSQTPIAESPENMGFYKSQRNTPQTHMTFETALLSSGYVYDAQPGVYMKEEENGVLHTYMQIDGDIWNYEKYDADDKVLMTKEFTL